jgi:hypothetical protein
MFKLFKISLFLIIFFSEINLGQTPSYGNLEIYTREAYLSSVGYFSGSFQ